MKHCDLTASLRVPHHIYFRSFDRGLIFYTSSDYLVYFTFITTVARHYGVTLMELSIMPDHVHAFARSRKSMDMKLFLFQTERRFAMEYNSAIGRTGRLFETSPGHAPKLNDKKIRTCVAYLFNNQVEKKIVSRAELTRWNFMAFAVSDHPFSEPIRLEFASRTLRRAMKLVKYFRSQDKPLGYMTLLSLYSNLSQTEKEQLTDYIIATYNCLDYDSIIRYYGSYEKMLTAVNSNTGSEFDIIESFDTSSDAPFFRMAEVVSKINGLEDVKKVMTLSPDRKVKLANKLIQIPGVTSRHISKFLHMSIADR
ncbi:MAG: transposase [Bacteroidales bacterium]|nr:transposase [Bacteroidales bacterium]